MGYNYEKKFPFLLTMEDENVISFPFPPADHNLFKSYDKSPRWDIIMQIIHLFPQLMVIGLHGNNTASAPKVVEEAHSIEWEPAITQHPPAVANVVLDHLSNQTRAIPKGVLVNIYLHFDLFLSLKLCLIGSHFYDYKYKWTCCRIDE